MIEPFLFAGIIIMILVMSAVTVLASISAVKEKERINRKMRNLSIVFLCYMVLGFLQFYFIVYLQNGRVDKAAGCLSDLCYFVFLILWVDLITKFSSNELILSNKTMRRVTALYGTFAELIVVFAGRYTDFGEFYFNSLFWRRLLMTANAAYELWLLIMAGCYFIYAQRHMEAGYGRNMSRTFSAALLVYMVWTVLSDYEMLHVNGSKMSELVLIDPLMVAYSVLGAWIIYIFFKKDPLKLRENQENVCTEENIKRFAAGNNLTRREAEVLELVCRGMNNPSIAENLCIAENTVKRHLNNIFQKTGASNRYELISFVWKIDSISDWKENGLKIQRPPGRPEK